MNTPYGHSRAFSDHAVGGGAANPSNRSSDTGKPDSSVQSYPTSSALNKDINTSNGGTLVPPPSAKDTATLTPTPAKKTSTSPPNKSSSVISRLKDDDELSISSNASTLTRNSSNRSDTGPSLMTTSTSTFKPPPSSSSTASSPPTEGTTSTAAKDNNCRPGSINISNKPKEYATLVSPGAKGVAPPPLPEKRIRAISGQSLSGVHFMSRTRIKEKYNIHRFICIVNISKAVCSQRSCQPVLAYWITSSYPQSDCFKSSTSMHTIQPIYVNLNYDCSLCFNTWDNVVTGHLHDRSFLTRSWNGKSFEQD